MSSRHMTVSFGMVSVPVRMGKATDDERGGVSFRNLCPDDHQPVKSKSHCAVDDHVVAFGEFVKGFERAKGQYVTFTEAELDELPLRTAKTIDVETFVAPDAIPFAVFQTGAYYLEPDAGGDKAFALVRAGLVTTGKVGLAKVSVGSRERICSIEPWGKAGMIVRTLHWPENVRSAADVQAPAVNPKEVALAVQLIDALTGEWNPAEFKDGYKAALMSAVEAKVAGQPMPTLPEVRQSPVGDLMAALTASIAATQKAKAAKPAASAKPAAAKPAAKRGRAA